MRVRVPSASATVNVSPSATDTSRSSPGACTGVGPDEADGHVHPDSSNATTTAATLFTAAV